MGTPVRPLIGITYSSNILENSIFLRDVFQGVVEAGGTPLSIDCDQPQATVRRIVPRLDGLIITGGGDVDPRRYGGSTDDPTLMDVNPVRDALEIEALELARAAGIPVLAICRGMQLLNVALGGTLYADLDRDRPGSIPHRKSQDALAGTLHDVRLEPGCAVAKWANRDGDVAVNSQHHQALRELAPGLRAVAWAPDGVVEAVEDAQRRVYGVQWHPEVLWRTEESAAGLLTGFVAHCVR